MYGAILGDIIGSPYEYNGGIKTKQFPFFRKESTFTDDSVMTIAIGEALMNAGKEASLEVIKENAITSMQKWGQRYPFAGYGGNFYTWLFTENPQPYNSYGNGSAMRVSPVGWLYDSLDRTIQVATAVSEVSHNHPEGIKGACATAASIYLSRNKKTKEEIKQFITQEYGYNLEETCDEIRKDYSFDVSCQGTVPQAIIAFLEGNDFEDVIRNAVSLAGDCDTLTCIAGSMAEAYYGVPEYLKEECRNRITNDMREEVERFYQSLI